ncbi:hypothetical protein Belba_2945 [Belliella baltica DSM 15883]|uniref:Uncharacterized protein n=1 Tax=Belliella baltica (strain DSM 15883 / CIP 108006 / LMG 21964 / BA134) TaxID=866536 RepID=I3Z8A7_BELBD|nr:hypothetical protein [Belliella baltica]AFL85475.1 hypothetical protein Belba_2945 [Belliella baltica DSM 15883]
MKKLLYSLIIFFLIMSCEDDKGDPIYTGNELAYTLYQASDFNYSGKLIVKEAFGGELILEIELQGEKDNEAYFFPAHLHFGSYDEENSPMAFMLEPIDIRTLKSSTVLQTLSNGETLTFEAFKSFDGHIKVHLAESGPDYSVILAVGNVGINAEENAEFKKDEISICLPSF